MKPWIRSAASLVRLFFRGKIAMRQNSLLWVLTISVEQGRPVGPMLEALSQDETSGRWKSRLDQLAKHVNSGMPLADALERVPGLLPPNVMLGIRVGAETNSLPEMLREISKDFSQQYQDDLDSKLSVSVASVAGLQLVLTSVVSFVMYYIIPKFKKIFEDFGTELPDLTEFIIEVSDFVMQYAPIALIGGAVLLIWVEWRNRRGTPGSLFRWLLYSHARSQTPVLLKIMGVVVQAGKPLAGAFSTMARHHISPTVRNHLLYLRNEVERGREPFELLVETGFLTKGEARVLEAAQRAGNLPWALEELAGRVERDLNYNALLILEIVRPIVLLAVAILVGIFAIGMFLPLVKLINDLS